MQYKTTSSWLMIVLCLLVFSGCEESKYPDVWPVPEPAAPAPVQPQVPHVTEQWVRILTGKHAGAYGRVVNWSSIKGIGDTCVVQGDGFSYMCMLHEVQPVDYVPVDTSTITANTRVCVVDGIGAGSHGVVVMRRDAQCLVRTDSGQLLSCPVSSLRPL